MSRHDTDRIQFDPDSDWQDSAQAIEYEAAPRVPRDREPMSLGALLLAVVIVCPCAATVLVACDPQMVADCAAKACT